MELKGQNKHKIVFKNKIHTEAHGCKAVLTLEGSRKAIDKFLKLYNITEASSIEIIIKPIGGLGIPRG